MKQNLSSVDKKKIITDIIIQVGLQSQKPQRKLDIINCLQLIGPGEDGASLAFFKDRLADWIMCNYVQLKANTHMFLQYGNLKYLQKDSRDLLANVVKICQEKLGDTIDYNDMFHGILMKNPYLNYQHLNYMYPPPYMVPPNYTPERQNYQNYMDIQQQYYMQMSKYGGYPINNLFMPPMPMSMPKYPAPQNPEALKQYFPYGMSTAQQVSHPTFVQPQTQPQPQSVQKPKNQPQVAQNKKGTQTSIFCKPVKQTNNQKQTQQVDSKKNRQKQKHSKQTSKGHPFIIIPPNMCKIPRDEIPQRLPNLPSINKASSTLQNQVNSLNLQSPQIEQIQIVEKKPELPEKQRANPRPKRNQNTTNNLPQHLPISNLSINLALATKTQSEEDKFKKNVSEMSLSRNIIQVGSEYKQSFKDCCCKGYGICSQFYQCSDCKRKFHYQCNSKKQSKNQLQQTAQTCHFCYMKNLDPLNKVEAQIKVSYIMDVRHNKFLQFVDFQRYDSFIQRGSPFEIQVRSMRLQDAANLVPEYTWPDQCLVMLNHQKTIEFQALQHNSSLKKRKDMSIFLTSYIYYYNKNYNQRKYMPIGLEIKENTILDMSQKKIRNNYIFLFGIYLIKKKTPQQLCEQIMQDPTNKVNFAQKFFSQRTQQDQIQIQQIKVNLMDPFTWNLIDIPVRGKKCTHGQCFDLKTFLSFMNVQKVRQWRCPVCNRQCRSFYVDTQQLEVIKEFKKQQSEGSSQKFSKQISFHRDGRTLFVVQNQQEDGEEDRNLNSADIGKTRQISKEDKSK